jgi:nicotinate-nucleotide--dimethylbenzimidazole phosphoribosyltransferase
VTDAAGFAAPPIEAVELDGALARAVQAAIDAKTKPPGSLGRLESLALQLACVQQRAQPQFDAVEAIVFAGDHGVVAEGVSPYPQAVTAQMVGNFLAGGAAVCVFARSVGARLRVVDAGVATPLPAHPSLIDRRIAAGTANFVRAPAMDDAQRTRALGNGIELVRDLDADAFAFGEMGIGNTTCAAALMHALTGLDAGDCVGRGTGADAAMLERKRSVVAGAVDRHRLHSIDDRHARALAALREVGGFEVAMMAGAMLGAAATQRMFIVDGFIATAAYAVAVAIEPALRGYAVFAHVSAEAPHARWLQALDAQPLLDLGLRLGEGSGAVLAVPLLRAACAMLGEMATFDSAGVSGRGAG